MPARDLGQVDAHVTFGVTADEQHEIATLEARAFGSEEVLFGTGSADVSKESWFARLRASAPRGRVPDATQVLLFVAMLAVLFFYGGTRLQLALGEQGLLAAEWLLLFAPALALVVYGRFDLVETLSLRMPSARAG